MVAKKGGKGGHGWKRVFSLIAFVIITFFLSFYMFLAVLPRGVTHIYRQGPEILGGWAGAPDSTICSHLTSYGLVKGHWDDNPDICEKLIETHINAWIIGPEYFVMGLAFYCVFTFLAAAPGLIIKTVLSA